jgi:hypothetical protein
MAVAPVKESGSVDAPPPISPSTSVLSLLLAVGGVCLVGLALLGGLYATVSHATKHAPTPTTVATTPTAPPPTNPAGTTDTSVVAGVAPAVRPLSDVVLATTPSGYTPVDPGDGPNGAFDLEGFLQFAENPRADRIRFEQNGFVGGFARSWRRAGPLGESRIIASVFEFSTAEGAKAIEEYESGRTVRDDEGVPFTLSGASALQFKHQVGKTTVYGFAVTIRREGDNRLYYLTALYPTQLPPTEIIDLTRQQQRLARAGG